MIDKMKTTKNQINCSRSSTSCSGHSACDQDNGLRWSGRSHNRRHNTQISNGNVCKSESSSEVEEKRADPMGKRGLECVKSSTCEASSSRESNSSSRKKRKLEGVMEQKKHWQFSRSNKSFIIGEDKEKLGSSSRRKRSTKGRIEKKNMKFTMLSWLIDRKVVQENEEVFSTNSLSEPVENKGEIHRGGILCACCRKTFTAKGFLLHGGKRCDKPYESILVARTRVSLLFHMFEAWMKPEEADCCKTNNIETRKSGDFYDDACMICADGGNLMCCEGCNSTYHQVCIGLKDVPDGSWYCPYCVCKFCADPMRENDYLVTCPLCEKRYHWECHQMKDDKVMDLNSIPLAPFCEHSCKQVHDKIVQNLFGKRNGLGEGYSWTLLHRMDDGFGMYIEDKYLRRMLHCKLAISRKLMEDSFEPIQDRHTKIKVIPSVVYNCGANFNRIDFKGFYTAVLEKDEEIISVASLRIHGTKLAEMPFIATSEQYRCKGMCRKLMAAIESVLCYLNVENLIIPSVSERIETWVDRYGFQPLNGSMEKEIMVHNTLMFHDSVRLQKTLLSPSHLELPPIPATTKRNTQRSNDDDGSIDKSKMSAKFDLNLDPFA